MKNKQIVYALINSAMPGLIKIGKTTQENISIRLSQLYSTGVPVPFECIYAVEVNDCTRVERAVHIAFGPYRINPNREFFKIKPEQAISILELLGPNSDNITDKITEGLNINTNQIELNSREKLKKRPPINFYEMGINKGEKLVFIDDESIEVEVYNNKKIKYNDEILSLTKVTQNILKLSYAIQPTPKWTYNEKILTDIYEEIYPNDE